MTDIAKWTRRETLALGLVGSTALVGFGTSLVTAADGERPDGLIAIGPLKQRLREVVARGGVLYVERAKAYLVALPKDDGTGPELLGLAQRCPHLGSKVTFCASSEFFECLSHGARFNRVGEYQFGPAVRGMDRLTLRVIGKDLYIQPNLPQAGPARGTDTLHQRPAGPFCSG